MASHLLVELDLLLQELLVDELHVPGALPVERVNLGQESVGHGVGAPVHLQALALAHLALDGQALELLALALRTLETKQ